MAAQGGPGDAIVQEMLDWAQEELRRARVESPRLTAELLLAHVLGWDRVRVISHHRDGMKQADAEAFSILTLRRACGEPLQYLTGAQEFFGLRFVVTPAVLIPRPETEILVERALSLAGESEAGTVRFADVGTGSGCIAVSFALREARASGWAVDLSMEALAVAGLNAANHAVADRVRFLRGDLLEAFAASPVFDLIMSNPPYVARNEAENLAREVRDHEPHLALFAGGSGLEAYGRLIPQAAVRLKPGGRLLLELGAGMADAVSLLAERQGLVMDGVEKDLSGIPRCLTARRPHG